MGTEEWAETKDPRNLDNTMNPESQVLDPALIHWVSPFTFLHLFPKGETWSRKNTKV